MQSSDGCGQFMGPDPKDQAWQDDYPPLGDKVSPRTRLPLREEPRWGHLVATDRADTATNNATPGCSRD